MLKNVHTHQQWGTKFNLKSKEAKHFKGTFAVVCDWKSKDEEDFRYRNLTKKLHNKLRMTVQVKTMRIIIRNRVQG
jgi:hypothetical protein